MYAQIPKPQNHALTSVITDEGTLGLFKSFFLTSASIEWHTCNTLYV